MSTSNADVAGVVMLLKRIAVAMKVQMPVVVVTYVRALIYMLWILTSLTSVKSSKTETNPLDLTDALHADVLSTIGIGAYVKNVIS